MKKENKNKNKKPKLIYLIMALVLFLAGLQLVMAHCLATTGDQMRQLEEKADLIKKKNQLLTEEINKMGSLNRVASEAGKLGLVKANNFLNLTPQVPVALEKTSINVGR
jgi:cell division protein FtsL